MSRQSVKQQENRIPKNVYLVSIVHRHADATTVFEREHFHSVFFPSHWCKHQLEFTGLFNDIISSLVLKHTTYIVSCVPSAFLKLFNRVSNFQAQWNPSAFSWLFGTLIPILHDPRQANIIVIATSTTLMSGHILPICSWWFNKQKNG